MKTYRGRVHRINSRIKNELAELRIVKGNKVSIVRIEVRFLLAANIAYCGAAFFLCLSERGASQTMTIKPNKSANKKDADRVKKLMDRDAREVDAFLIGKK